MGSEQHHSRATLDGAASSFGGLGERLRARRAASGVGVRELARRIGVSASLISQIETGKVQPSVNTLYAMVAELSGSFDELLFGESDVEPAVMSDTSGQTSAVVDADPPSPTIQRAAQRKSIELNHGVRWERLTRGSEPGVEFLYVVYESGAASAPPDDFQRHTGREWCYVISGALRVTIGPHDYVLNAGDSMTFDASLPHRLAGTDAQKAEAVWFLIR